ncbi:DUF4158 domain-containing protein [Streptomyces sp. NPDC046985]|uniref:DUF4158 domain-containing protein n=1 Tax=Streptomyces sp. NPDC046985 TaxID=3155377 RepID=UPI0033C00F2C
MPDEVVEFVHRAAELPESTLPVYVSGRTAERHRSLARERCGVRYDGQAARALAEETMRVAAASKNNPADLVNISLEKLVEANLEITRFSTLDAMASTVRGQVSGEILAGVRGRMTLAKMFCKRMAAKAKKAREELAEIHRQQQEIVVALIGNYRTLLQQVDKEGPAQTARSKAAALTKDALDALEGLDEESSPAEVAERLEGKVSLAFLLLAEGLMVQSNGLGSLLSAVDKLGGFEAQYAQIEKVSAHHGDDWEVLLHGHLKADRPVMFDLTDVIELKATSEDVSVLHALAHAKVHRTPARDYIPDRDADGEDDRKLRSRGVRGGGCVLGQEVGDGGADGAAADVVVTDETGDGPALQVRGAHSVGLGGLDGRAVPALVPLGFGGPQAVVRQLPL